MFFVFIKVFFLTLFFLCDTIHTLFEIIQTTLIREIMMNDVQINAINFDKKVVYKALKHLCSFSFIQRTISF